MIHTWTLIIKFWAKKKSLKIRDFFKLWRSGRDCEFFIFLLSIAFIYLYINILHFNI
jgi:hypothetical protein